jgi:hypothetical protein
MAAARPERPCDSGLKFAGAAWESRPLLRGRVLFANRKSQTRTLRKPFAIPIPVRPARCKARAKPQIARKRGQPPPSTPFAARSTAAA